LYKKIVAEEPVIIEEPVIYKRNYDRENCDIMLLLKESIRRGEAAATMVPAPRSAGLRYPFLSSVGGPPPA
jgi:hypothetical protein